MYIVEVNHIIKADILKEVVLIAMITVIRCWWLYYIVLMRTWMHTAVYHHHSLPTFIVDYTMPPYFNIMT